MVTTIAAKNPFEEANEIVRYNASLVLMTAVTSKFADGKGNYPQQARIVLVRWPSDDGSEGRPKTFSQYYGGKTRKTLSGALQRILGFRTQATLWNDVIAMLPLHLVWEERPQADFKNAEGVFQPRRDLLVPLSIVEAEVSEDVVVEIANALKTEEEMESETDGDPTSSASAETMAAVNTALARALDGKTPDEAEAAAAELAETLAEEYGSKFFAYISSGEALNALMVESHLVNEKGKLVDKTGGEGVPF